MLWPSSAVVFRRVFDWALSRLQLAELRFTPAGLRAGGTTHLFRTGMPLSTVKYRGGWAADRTLAAYVQEGMAAMVWNSLPSESAQALAATARKNSDLLLHAPHLAWPLLFKRRERTRTLKRS